MPDTPKKAQFVQNRPQQKRTVPAQRPPDDGLFYDSHAVRASAKEVNQVKGFRPQDPPWDKQYASERVEAMQELEVRFARAQGRRPVPVVGYEGPSNEYGYYCPDRDQIFVNKRGARFHDRDAMVELIGHEGSHAYEQQVIQNPALRPELGRGPSRVEQFRQARPSAGIQDPVQYAHNAREFHAGPKGQAIAKTANPKHQVGHDQAAQIWDRERARKYGHLKPTSGPTGNVKSNVSLDQVRHKQQAPPLNRQQPRRSDWVRRVRQRRQHQQSVRRMMNSQRQRNTQATTLKPKLK